MEPSEFSPSGTGAKKRFSKAELRKLHEQAKKADILHKKAEEHHLKNDIPAAEQMLEEELKKLG